MQPNRGEDDTDLDEMKNSRDEIVANLRAYRGTEEDLTPAVVALLQNVGEAPNQKPKQCGKRKEPQDEVGDNIIRIG